MKTKYENTLFYQIHSSAKFFDKLFEQFFKEINLGVTSIEHLALIIIEEYKECCQRDLAKILLKDRANTGKLANALEQKKLIEIVLSTKNNRPVKILKITEKGRKLIKQSRYLFEPIKNEIENIFSEEKLEDLKKSLNNFRKTVEKVIKTNI